MITSNDQFIALVRRCANIDFSVNLHRFLRVFGFALMAVVAAPNTALAQEHDHSQMDHGDMQEQEEIGTDCFKMSTISCLESSMMLHGSPGSGTSLLPDREGGHTGLHIMLDDDFMLMAHGYAWGVYTDQSGPRGGDKAYVQSMAMLTAQKETDWGRLQLKSMMSLEPLMKNRGYPNLFATGETAGGEPLVDRQHPHDLFMELAARVDFNVGDTSSVFVYGGPVGEPALGPSAFMHRGSAKLNPEAPITHHWFDSNHITYGVATVGFTNWWLQIEGSIFTGRELDEARWNIEKPRFDSWSVRATVNPSANWTVQASTGRLKQPEYLIHPDEDEQRTTASVHYATGDLSAMLAFSAKDRKPGPTLTAWLAEVNWNLGEHHTLFGRAENVRNDELFPEHTDPLHEVPFRISKFQLGYAYRLPLTDIFNLALGGTVSAFAKSAALDAAYGNKPMGYTLFARLSLGL
ncbi:MAG: hypothetical protein ABL928_09705 [Sphingorhabdus sp.]